MCFDGNKRTNTIRNEQDTAWKEVLDVYFKQFLDYCLPQLSELIDWDKPICSLDKELQVITKGAQTGKCLLDKLVKVFLKNGQEQCILIHIEIQAEPNADFPKRMFIYGYRMWDKYQQPLVSCAILTDGSPNWRPSNYEVQFAGSRLSAEFLTIKILDYKDKQEELESSNNPFASVILAQLAAIEAQSKPQEHRKNVKLMLTKRLYEKGFKKQEIVTLYKFIDWLIGLPRELEVEYLEEVYNLEEAMNMPYVSTAERFGIEKGWVAGNLRVN